MHGKLEQIICRLVIVGKQEINQKRIHFPPQVPASD